MFAAQTGPFPPTAWPATINPTATVHYLVTDGGLSAPNANWAPELTVLSGGDQQTAEYTIGGFTGVKVTGSYLNTADNAFEAWADVETIDILVEAYGDAALFSAAGNPRNFNFLTGILPNLAFPNGGQVAVEAKNKKWNWILFRIPNGFRPDGTRFVGSIPGDAQGSFAKGGVNGGTIRMESVPNLIVRAIAWVRKARSVRLRTSTSSPPPMSAIPSRKPTWSASTSPGTRRITCRSSMTRIRP